MITTTQRVLSDADLEGFYRDGYVVVRQAFSREDAQGAIDIGWKRIGYDPDAPSTWAEPLVGTGDMHSVSIETFAPRAYGAICELMGGRERIAGEMRFGDGFKWNFYHQADNWQPPSAQAKLGWHTDGDWFRHFLDGPEQGILGIALWSDVKPRGGGTYIVPDSVAPVARQLAAHPEGLLNWEMGEKEILPQCEHFMELTGEIGDVFLTHPFMIHSVSPNERREARPITNPCISFREPLRFDDPDQMCPIERSIMSALGVESLDYQITGERGRVVTKRMNQNNDAVVKQFARIKNLPEYHEWLETSGWRQNPKIQELAAES